MTVKYIIEVKSGDEETSVTQSVQILNPIEYTKNEAVIILEFRKAIDDVIAFIRMDSVFRWRLEKLISKYKSLWFGCTVAIVLQYAIRIIIIVLGK